MAKTIAERLMDQGLMMVAREFWKGAIKAAKPKIKAILDGSTGNPSGKRKTDEE